MNKYYLIFLLPIFILFLAISCKPKEAIQKFIEKNTIRGESKKEKDSDGIKKLFVVETTNKNNSTNSSDSNIIEVKYSPATNYETENANFFQKLNDSFFSYLIGKSKEIQANLRDKIANANTAIAYQEKLNENIAIFYKDAEILQEHTSLLIIQAYKDEYGKNPVNIQELRTFATNELHIDEKLGYAKKDGISFASIKNKIKALFNR